MPLEIGFSTNYNNLEIYKDLSVMQFTLDDPSDPNYNESYEVFKNVPKKIFLHSKYSYNISKKNINYSIKKESEYLKALKRPDAGIVIHLSKYYHSSRKIALIDVANKLNILCESYLRDTDIKILIESSSHLDHLGSIIADFYIIFKNLNDIAINHVFICLDTSHIYLSGKDISSKNGMINYLVEFEKMIGLKKIKLIHLNDIDSTIFGRHTPHLAINDGVIFKKNKTILEFVLLLAKKYQIPIILERSAKQYTIAQIMNEIKFLQEYDLHFNTETFEIIILSLLFNNYLDTLKDFYIIIEPSNSERNTLLNELKDEIKSVLEYSKEKNAIQNIIMNPKYSLFAEPFTAFFKVYDYDSFFLPLLNHEKYKSIKDLMSIKFIGVETAQKLYSLGITNVESLKEKEMLKELIKNKILTQPQTDALKAYHFLKKEGITFKIASVIENIITTGQFAENFDLTILGSYARLKKENNSDFTDNRDSSIIKDIDLLFVGYDKIYEFIEMIKTHPDFVYKGSLINGKMRKILIFNFKIKRTSNFFILDIFICSEEEKPFMELFLSNTKIRNIVIRNVAKNKGYKLTERGITSINNENETFKFKTVKELYEFLKITEK